MRLGRSHSIDEIMFSLAKPGEECQKSECPRDRDPGQPETATVFNLERCACECPQEGNCDPAAQPPTFWNPEECACKTCNNLAEAQNTCQQNPNKDILVRDERCFCECPPFECKDGPKTKKDENECKCVCPETKTEQQCRFIGGIQREDSKLIFDEENCKCSCPIQDATGCPNFTENTRLDPITCECYEFPVENTPEGPVFAVNQISGEGQAFRAMETPVAKCVEESEYLANPGKYEKLEGPFNNMQNCEFWSEDFPGYWQQTEACWSVESQGLGVWADDTVSCDCYRSGNTTEGSCAWGCSFLSELKQTCDPQNYTFNYSGAFECLDADKGTTHPPTRYPLFWPEPIMPMDPIQTGSQPFFFTNEIGDCPPDIDTSCPGGFLPKKSFPCPSSTSGDGGDGGDNPSSSSASQPPEGDSSSSSSELESSSSSEASSTSGSSSASEPQKSSSSSSSGHSSSSSDDSSSSSDDSSSSSDDSSSSSGGDGRTPSSSSGGDGGTPSSSSGGDGGTPSSSSGEPTSEPEDPSSSSGDGTSSSSGEPTSEPEDPSSSSGEPTIEPEDPSSSSGGDGGTPSSSSGEPTSEPEDPSSSSGEPTSEPEDPSSSSGDGTSSSSGDGTSSSSGDGTSSSSGDGTSSSSGDGTSSSSGDGTSSSSGDGTSSSSGEPTIEPENPSSSSGDGTSSSSGDGGEMFYCVLEASSSSSESSSDSEDGEEPTTFEFQNPGFAYTITGYMGDNPAITVERGKTYNFDFQAVASGHPIALRLASGSTAAVPGTTGNNPSAGVRGPGAIVTYTVPMDAPDTLVYQCIVHASMIGTINVVDASVYNYIDGRRVIFGEYEVASLSAPSLSPICIPISSLDISRHTVVGGPYSEEECDASCGVDGGSSSSSEEESSSSSDCSSGMDRSFVGIQGLNEEMDPEHYYGEDGFGEWSVGAGVPIEIRYASLPFAGLFPDDSNILWDGVVVASIFYPPNYIGEPFAVVIDGEVRCGIVARGDLLL